MLFQTINGQWGGDLWEHASVVRELATHPLSPKHPVLLLDAPHLFYSPYALGIALVSRTTGLDAVTTLGVAGIANLVFFLFSFKFFISMLFPENSEATSFYALLFVLFLWGISQWCWSSFFNLLSLSYTLPYPSTFSASMVFTALGMWILLTKSRSMKWIIPITAVSCIVLLTHPLTYLFLAVGLVAIMLAEQPFHSNDVWLIVFVWGVSLLAAALWPYYPFFRGILFDAEFHSSIEVTSITLYQSIPSRILPALAGLPIIIFRMIRNWRDPLGLMFVMLVLIYAGAALFKQWTYGRAISYIVITLQIALGAAVAQLESKLNYVRLSPSFQKGIYCLVIVLVCLGCSARYIPHILQRSVPDSPSARTEFAFLSRFVPQYDVVISDFATKLIIPTFGGKLVASNHPLAFVPDHDQRRKDVNDFFSPKSDYNTRLAILRKYGCRHILVSKENPASQEIIRSFLPMYSVAYEDNQFALLSLGPRHVRPGSPGITSFNHSDSSRQ
jgi:hypothetical protein